VKGKARELRKRANDNCRKRREREPGGAIPEKGQENVSFGSECASLTTGGRKPNRNRTYKPLLKVPHETGKGKNPEGDCEKNRGGITGDHQKKDRRCSPTALKKDVVP